MKLYTPRSFAVDDKVPAGNSVKQIKELGKELEGSLASYSAGKIRGWLFTASESNRRILLLSRKSKELPSTFSEAIAVDVPEAGGDIDASECEWLRSPVVNIAAQPGTRHAEIEKVHASWKGAFSYTEATLEKPGLRAPQLGALHAINAHWIVDSSPATVVMPTGTGKTETMLCVMVSRGCSKVMIVVPSDALRRQIADKFLELGILQSPKINVLAKSALYPFVCSLEHLPRSTEEADEIMDACQVCVTTSAILGSCSPEIQMRFAARCPYLFIDEAHHVEARTWSLFRNKFAASRILQFTATPFREDGRLIEGNPIFRFPLRLAQAQGYFTRIAFRGINVFDKKAADREIAQKAIEQLARDRASNLQHIVMARTGTTQRASDVAKIYRELAPSSRIIEMHTKISAKQRRLDKAALLRGEADIVVCVDMLGEGFDLPQLKIAAFHDVRQSLAITLQLAGRFTRARTDLGDATFIADVSDPSVSDELKRLYNQDPDWNAILPQLSDAAIAEQASIRALVSHFGELAPGFSLQSVRPATSAVVYKTQCSEWNPENFRAGIPCGPDCEQIYHTINHEEKMIIVITGSRVGLSWTDDESVSSWEWELYIGYWNSTQHLLFINGSSNKGDFSTFAKALTGEKSTLITGDRVFRVFGGISLLRLQNVGLTQFQGRNIRYTQRMGSDVDPSIPKEQRANSQKAVIAGFGFERGAMTSI